VAWKCTVPRFAVRLEHTETHVQVLRDLFAKLDLDAETETPGRAVVRHIGESLVKAMETGEPDAAELVAAECVVHAETKDHLDWELIGMLAGKAKGDVGQALKEAHEQVEEEEDEHWYKTSRPRSAPPAPRQERGRMKKKAS